MKAGKKHNALEGIKKAQPKRRVFTLEFTAEVVRHNSIAGTCDMSKQRQPNRRKLLLYIDSFP